MTHHRPLSAAQELAVASGSLRVVFDRRADRWGHSVELASEQGPSALLFTSVEDASHGDVPTSPPVQDLHFQEGSDGKIQALGVGMAGRNHWSIACSVRPTGKSDAAAGSLRFEIACRVRDDRPSLTSTYRLAAGVQNLAAQSGLLELAVADRRIRIHTGNAVVALTDDGFALTIHDYIHWPPYTVQWSYRVDLLD